MKESAKIVKSSKISLDADLYQLKAKSLEDRINKINFDAADIIHEDDIADGLKNSGFKMGKETFAELIEEEKKRILKDALKEAEELKEKACKQGEAEGYKKGELAIREELNKEFENELKISKGLIKGLNEYKNKIYEAAGKDLLKLSAAIAEKVIMKEIDSDNEIIINELKFALKTIPQIDNVILHVSPLDLEYLKKNINKIDEILGRYKEFKLIDDPDIGKGSLLLETEEGNIDIRIKNQIENIVDELSSV